MIFTKLVAATVSIAMVIPWSAGAKQKGWEFHGNNSFGIAGFSGIAEDGRSELGINCNKRLGRTLAGALREYAGSALPRVDDQTTKASLEIMNEGKLLRSFKLGLYYFAPDEAWAYDGLSGDFLDAVHQGQSLILRSGKDVIAQFDIHWPPQKIAQMKDICEWTKK